MSLASRLEASRTRSALLINTRLPRGGMQFGLTDPETLATGNPMTVMRAFRAVVRHVDYLPACDPCGGAALSRFIAEPGPYCHTVLQCATDG